MGSVSNHYSSSHRAWFVQVNASCPLSYSWVFPRKAMPGWQMWHTIYGRPVQFWSGSWRPGWLPWHFSLDPVFTWCLSEHPFPVLFPLPRPLPVLPVAQALFHLHGHGRTGSEERSLQVQGKGEEDMAWASVMPSSQMDVQLQPKFMCRWYIPWATATGKQCSFSPLSRGVCLCTDIISHQIQTHFWSLEATLQQTAGNSEQKVLTSSVWKHSYSQQKDSSA